MGLLVGRRGGEGVVGVFGCAPLVREIVVGGGVEVVEGLFVGRREGGEVLRVFDSAPLVREIVVGEGLEDMG